MLAYLLALSLICTLPNDKVETAISDYVETNFGNADTEYQYDLRRVIWSNLPEACDSVAVISISKDNPLGNTLFNVAFFDTSGLVRIVPISVEVTALMKVLVASTPIKSGELMIDCLPSKRVISDGHMIPVTDAAKLTGRQARVNIQTGNIIYPSMIESASVMKLGDKVEIVVEKGMIRITADGIARQRGGIGDIIKVMNVSSRKLVKAEIVDSTTVALR